MVRFLLDSCVAIFAVNGLRQAGHEVLWISESGKDLGDEAVIGLIETHPPDIEAKAITTISTRRTRVRLVDQNDSS